MAETQSQFTDRTEAGADLKAEFPLLDMEARVKTLEAERVRDGMQAHEHALYLLLELVSAEPHGRPGHGALGGSEANTLLAIITASLHSARKRALADFDVMAAHVEKLAYVLGHVDKLSPIEGLFDK